MFSSTLSQRDTLKAKSTLTSTNNYTFGRVSVFLQDNRTILQTVLHPHDAKHVPPGTKVFAAGVPSFNLSKKVFCTFSWNFGNHATTYHSLETFLF